MPMIKNLQLFLLLLVSFASVFPPTIVVAQEDPAQEIESGAVVCAPGAYPIPPDDCLPLGPSVYITEMAGLGLTFPERALPAFRPDPALTDVPYRYFRLDE